MKKDDELLFTGLEEEMFDVAEKEVWSQIVTV